MGGELLLINEYVEIILMQSAFKYLLFLILRYKSGQDDFDISDCLRIYFNNL